METIVVGAHIFICLFLIGIILLQAGKGADVGAVFGGASQTMFGGRGPASFLNKLTIGVSALFLITAIWLTQIGQQKGTESVVGKVPVEKTIPEAKTTSGETTPVPAGEEAPAVPDGK